MGINEEELYRLADEMYKDRRIASSTYCGSCGYNLRTLPYRYCCPECGQEYNARPQVMKGIFTPQAADFPYGSLLYGLILLGCAVGVGYPAIKPANPSRLWLAGVLLVIALIYGAQVYGRLKQFFKTAAIMQRILAEEQGERS